MSIDCSAVRLTVRFSGGAQRRPLQPDVSQHDLANGLAHLANSPAAPICNAVPVGIANLTLYRALMTSWSFAVSTYCWNRVTLPSLTSQTWQTWVSILFPVALYLPL